ncbi:hypothetical protein [Chryseobacterium mulctrae]|uniref:hypothetical protein n=1 Tax=Chryseobacterium mulctrae TaxID=2576777 RepID=UPI0011177949|nr:hypothetical protein [Chryseobacterium mulctrae]
MDQEQIKEMWGDKLYNAFANYINDEGWLIGNWAAILENDFSDWDNNYNDTNEKSNLYSRMYNLDYEVNEDSSGIRPK